MGISFGLFYQNSFSKLITKSCSEVRLLKTKDKTSKVANQKIFFLEYIKTQKSNIKKEKKTPREKENVIRIEYTTKNVIIPELNCSKHDNLCQLISIR